MKRPGTYAPLTERRFDVLKRGDQIRRTSDGMVLTCLGRGAERLQFEDTNGRVGWVKFAEGDFERVDGGAK